MTIDTNYPLNILLGLNRAQYYTKLSELEYEDILIVNLPNRFGKTVTTLNYFNDHKGKVLYLSDRHEQIKEIEDGGKFTHWYGLEQICERKDDKFIDSLIKNGLHANIVCRFCNEKNCRYKQQFNIPNDVIVVAPKQFIQTKYVTDDIWDAVILDENIENGKKINYVYPKIPEEIFDSYYVDYEFYKEVGAYLKNPPNNKSMLNKLRMDGFGCAADIKTIIGMDQSKNNQIGSQPHERNLISYLNNIGDTIEWISYASKYGAMEHYYKPYLHYAFDLRKENKSKIIILNTSIEKWIYEQIAGRYDYPLPEPIYYNLSFNNKESLLLDYSNSNRSCNKGAITETKGFFSSKRHFFGGKYGSSIIEMVSRAISYANNKGLKVGIITYKDLLDDIINKFSGKFHIISYFGGHQGSNKFDDVDILIIIGTYHINPLGLYQTHYKITNEYLKHRPANMRALKEIINGKQIYLSDNDAFNKVKLYKLNEEHEQAIYRSGAHIKPGKIVINFGFVPEGVEKTLTYKQFKSKEQLLGFLSRLNQCNA